MTTISITRINPCIDIIICESLTVTIFVRCPKIYWRILIPIPQNSSISKTVLKIQMIVIQASIYITNNYTHTSKFKIHVFTIVYFIHKMRESRAIIHGLLPNGFNINALNNSSINQTIQFLSISNNIRPALRLIFYMKRFRNFDIRIELNSIGALSLCRWSKKPKILSLSILY